MQSKHLVRRLKRGFMVMFYRSLKIAMGQHTYLFVQGSGCRTVTIYMVGQDGSVVSLNAIFNPLNLQHEGWFTGSPVNGMDRDTWAAHCERAMAALAERGGYNHFNALDPEAHYIRTADQTEVDAEEALES